MSSMVLLFLLVTGGAFVTSLTGLGGGTLVLAGLMLVYPPELAIPLHSFTQFTSNALRTGFFFKHVHWKAVAAYAALMLPAAWAAGMIFDFINPSVLKILVGIFILISIIPLKFKPKDEPSLKTFVVLGGFSSFFGVFVGSIGPAVTPFFNRLKINRDGNISTKAAGQMFLQVSKIIAFSGAAGVDFVTLKDHVGLLIVGTLFGVLVSIPISKKISDQKFDVVVNLLLGIISVKVLVEGIRELL